MASDAAHRAAKRIAARYSDPDLSGLIDGIEAEIDRAIEEHERAAWRPIKEKPDKPEEIVVVLGGDVYRKPTARRYWLAADFGAELWRHLPALPETDK